MEYRKLGNTGLIVSESCLALPISVIGSELRCAARTRYWVASSGRLRCGLIPVGIQRVRPHPGQVQMAIGLI